MDRSIRAARGRCHPRTRSQQPVPPAPLQWPALEIGEAAGGQIVLEWFWPEEYQHKVQFQIVSTTDLNLPPTTQNVVPVHVGGGQFRVTFSGQTTGMRFFRAQLILR